MEKIPQLSNFEKAAVFLFVMRPVDSCYLLKILSHRFQIQEVGEVILGSCLGICSGYVESAEWMLQNNSSS